MLHHAGRLVRAAGLGLPISLGLGAVQLEAVEAGERVVGRRHVSRHLRGEVRVQPEVVAEILLAQTDGVVQAVPEHAVLANLAASEVVPAPLVLRAPAASEVNVLCVVAVHVVRDLNTEVLPLVALLPVVVPLMICCRYCRYYRYLDIPWVAGARGGGTRVCSSTARTRG